MSKDQFDSDYICIYNNYVFEWNVFKAMANLQKHGVSFEDAMEVFFDLDALESQRLIRDEVRGILLGKSSEGRVLLVVYTLRRNKHGTEKIRIISARAASRKERARYS